MTKGKNPGDLFQLKSSVEFVEDDPPRFFFIVGDNKINSKADWFDRFPVNHETLPLMLIKSVSDLTPDTMGCQSARASTAVSWDDYALVEEMLESEKHVPGSIFMVPDGRLIWISDIDFKYFEEVEL